jgi:hypothetical protein
MTLVLIFMPGGIEGVITRAFERWQRRQNMATAEA